MTDKTLDEIMSGRDETVAADDQDTTPQEQPQDAGPARDEHGKFAQKAEKPADEPPSDADPDGEPDDKLEARPGIPPAALKAEREKAKAERERAERFERELAEVRGAMQLLTQQRQQPEQPKEEPKAPQVWEDPDAWMQHALTPVQQQMAQFREDMSRDRAVEKHGPEKVDEAYRAIAQALDTDPAARGDYQRIMQSPHPYGELVTWHERRKAMQEMADPDAYREKLKAELLAELQAAQPAEDPAPQQPAARTPMPSNFTSARNQGPRSGVTYSGPRPLSEITKGNSQ